MKLLIALACLMPFASSADTTTKTTTATTTSGTTGGAMMTAHTAQKETFPLIHAKDLNGMLTTNTKDSVFVYDANNEKTRKEYGTIPSAKLLGSAETYDVATTLPANKNAKLVFYCANEMCMASHDAAKRALAAGYSNVSVMADGIEGWKKSGFTVKK